MYQINESVVVLPNEDRLEAFVGDVTKVRKQTIIENGKKDEIELYEVNGTIYEVSALLGVGEPIAVTDDYGHDDVFKLTAITKTNDDVYLVFAHGLTIEPSQLYYCDECEAYHILYEDEQHDCDESNDCIECDSVELGYFIGYSECLHDVIEYLTGKDGNPIDEVLNNNFDGDLLEDHRADDVEFIVNLYHAIMDAKEQERLRKEEAIPQYTHEELVELIGHDFAIKE